MKEGITHASEEDTGEKSFANQKKSNCISPGESEDDVVSSSDLHTRECCDFNPILTLVLVQLLWRDSQGLDAAQGRQARELMRKNLSIK